jgi:hypothetical protein
MKLRPAHHAVRRSENKGLAFPHFNRMGVNMRILLLSSAAVALMGAGTALAADSASVQITATQAQSCTINDGGTSSALDLGTTVDAPIAGTFSYQCNFVGSPTLTFTSLSGGVTDATNTYDYGIYLNDAAPASPPSAWLQASASTGGVPFTGITSTTAPNTAVTPFFSVGLSEAIDVAGSYSDTLTIDIAP